MTINHDANPFAEDRDITIRHAVFEGREFTREADGKWRDAWGAELDPETLAISKPTTPPWKKHSLSRWRDRDIPKLDWFLPGWIPKGQIVGLYGTPGSRKSTLMLQLMIAGALGKGFASCPELAQGPTYGLFCEDGEFEIARRARQILTRYEASFADMTDCHAESLVSANLTRFVTFNRAGVMHTTPAWDQFLADLDDIQPVFVALDVVPDFFGGNEINRSQVHDFMRLLDHTAQQRNLAMLFAAHPSLSGIRDRSLRSGSTAWEGKTRARITIHDPDDDDDDLPNLSDKRTLTLAKANYAKHGATMNLVVRDGCFIPEDLDPETQKSKQRGPIDQLAAEAHFLDKLKSAIKQGRYVSNAPNTPVYAPAKFAEKTFPLRVLDAAMNRLFDKNILRIDPKKRGPDRWIINENAIGEAD